MNKISLMKPNSQYNVRSISFPARSHPTTLRIEEEINKLRSLEGVSSSTVSTVLSGLAELYACMGDLLSLPLTQQGLSQQYHEKWVNELLDGTLRYLDICGNTRDSVLLTKESVRELQSVLRRSMAGERSIEDNVRDYTCSRKNMKKEIAKSMALLKQMENGIGEQSPPLEQSHHLSVLVRVLGEASLITISTLRSLLLFLSPSLLKPKGTKWLLISKLVRKGIVLGEVRDDMNELQSAKVAVGNLTFPNASEDIEAEKIESALEKLEALDGVFEDFEDGLELLFRICNT
ncbi:hypothetical protein SLEP1_g51364 [Rubroshorea leprosula]|uniref:Uncharacterized protein n=1 Tax=Rubroshorea leprosula TaxID=152421 RepID=A0AAV5M5J3_9ROSI|nr:hypothetical protein SLEP1_g51364 [Rubroshorea leprosula]